MMRCLAAVSLLVLAGSGPGSCVTRPPLAPPPDAGAVRDAGPQPDAPDHPPPPDSGVRPDLGRSLCTGAPQLDVNGAMYDYVGWEPTVEARVVPLDCCESAAIIFTPPDGTANRVVFRWRTERDRPWPWPPTLAVELYQPPAGFVAEVLFGCEEPLEECANPTDRAQTGDGNWVGTLQLTGLGGGPDYGMNLCLYEYTESPFSPHPALHWAALWSGQLTAVRR